MSADPEMSYERRSEREAQRNQRGETHYGSKDNKKKSRKKLIKCVQSHRVLNVPKTRHVPDQCSKEQRPDPALAWSPRAVRKAESRFLAV